MGVPIVVFAYRRKDHLQQTLDHLKKCRGCENSDVFVFSDGYKGEKDQQGVEQVREYLASIEQDNPFHGFTVVKAPKNKGLAKNVIGGVTEILAKYKRVIVVEDDTLVAPGFIEYMNQALDFYENDSAIFSVGGFTVPMVLPADYRYDIIYTQRISSCCWATWEDRWKKINWDMPDYSKFRFTPWKRKAFNKWGKDRSSMLDDQMNGRINSWAIRFDYYMWKNDMLNVIPAKSLARNIGMDGSGTHGVTQGNAPAVRLQEGGIVLKRIQTDERIRKEFSKNFATTNGALLKRYVGNLLFKMRRRN